MTGVPVASTLTRPTAQRPHITIIGGGPAGLAAVCGHEHIQTSTPIRSIEHDGRRIMAVRSDSGGPIPVDEVISSLPLSTVAEIRGHLDRFSNLRTIGRCGTFTYGWIHNMIREGRQAVASIGHGE